MAHPVRKILHTRIRVDDLDEMVSFLQKVFGLEEIRRSKSPRGSEIAFLKAPESEEEVEVTCFPKSGPVQVQEDLMHIAFGVEDMDAFGEHLRKVGVPFSEEPNETSSGSVIAFVDGPHGYEFELIQRPKS